MSNPAPPQDERSRIAELARATATNAPIESAKEPSLSEALHGYLERLRGGDIGSLPAILGLLVLVVGFSILRPETFPTASNLSNLMVQASAIIVLAMGLVFVLLLGDIDLSAGVAGGAGAGVMAVLMNRYEVNWVIAVLLALVVGVLIGLTIGLLVAVVGIPSFVVTLALFLALQGAVLLLIGEGGSVPVRNEVIVAIANRNVPVPLGWALAGVACVAYALVSLIGWQRKRARDLSRDNFVVLLTRVLVISALILAVTGLLSQNRARTTAVVLAGVPYSVPMIAVLLVVMTFVLARTRYGRYVYAVGGNAEAARRAGISVRRIRMSVFMIGSSLAVVSGIIGASRLQSVAPSAGGGNTLLLGVGAAVIGGTSLFGGKGKVSNAVIGGLVIATIQNGLGLLGQPQNVNFLVTGAVLLLAATVDALSRRRRASAAI